MSCEMTTQYLNDFLDGGLNENKNQEIQSHIKICETCRGLVEREQDLRAALRGLPAPKLRPDFVRSTLAMARQRREQQTRRWGVLGGAIAAGFALFVVVNLIDTTPMEQAAAVSKVMLEKGQVREVRLVFNSKTNLDDTTFVVQLPSNVALQGFPHQQSVTWKGRLKQGKNLLVLPVMATGPVEGDLIAWIKHAENKRAFHLAIQMNEGDLSRSSYRLVDMT